jgi:hypothetical protein
VVVKQFSEIQRDIARNGGAVRSKHDTRSEDPSTGKSGKEGWIKLRHGRTAKKFTNLLRRLLRQRVLDSLFARVVLDRALIAANNILRPFTPDWRREISERSHATTGQRRP